ncbi:MAG: hypothetical protein IPI39_14145 [Candidatus Obscuribacter sp.]|nr:hypothetical protein [Candidatus Obscuribacter sp.]
MGIIQNKLAKLLKKVADRLENAGKDGEAAKVESVVEGSEPAQQSTETPCASLDVPVDQPTATAQAEDIQPRDADSLSNFDYPSQGSKWARAKVANTFVPQPLPASSLESPKKATPSAVQSQPMAQTEPATPVPASQPKTSPTSQPNAVSQPVVQSGSVESSQPQLNFAAPADNNEIFETRVSSSFEKIRTADISIKGMDEDTSIKDLLQINTEVDLKVESIKKEAAAREEANQASQSKPAHHAPELVVSKGSSIIDSLLVSDWQAGDENLVFSERKTSDLSIATEDSFRIVAENPNTPPTTLNWMAGQLSVDVRSAVAGNPSTPQETLRRLASDRSSDVRQRVANNRKAGSDILRLLSNDKNKIVAGEARNMLVKKLKTCEMESTGANLLSTHKFRPTTNHVTATHSSMQALPQPTHLDGSPIEPTTGSGEWHALNSDDAKKAYVKQKDTVKDLKFNPASVYDRGGAPAPERNIVQPSPGDTIAFQTMVAARPTTPAARLIELAAHENEAVRRAVAENVATPPEAFAILAKDKAREVRLRLVENYSCPIDIVRQLENDLDPFVSYEARKIMRRAEHISNTEAKTFHVNPDGQA